MWDAIGEAMRDRLREKCKKVEGICGMKLRAHAT